ncbi:uncharacterized protein LOC123297888 [Chrysoperla carnea]|uniref:uncharacterized protein LOC123297888 n=1 Tax=Chrysoperla carnea TaxID=189513 RepID=UPI001D08EEF4|nr:uncharacterized protein LOC123297888 [Chrysoperla carnea]XP_044735641.1 uncharacterized protein LOC123297888 [Chrysoperla carnea]
MNDINNIEQQNCSEPGGTKSNNIPDSNANSKPIPEADSGTSNHRGAIPKRILKDDKNRCTKLNNNFGTRTCSKMGLGNCNNDDTNLELIKPYSLNKVTVDFDRNFIKKFNNIEVSDRLEVTANDFPPGPSNSQENNCKVKNSSSSCSSTSDISDTESEDTSLSISDDGCVYTYKGGSADLPDSFFIDDHQEDFYPRIEIPPLRQRSRESSPEMDYLEMDFDPGPSCEADSESSVDIDLDEQNIQVESSHPPVAIVKADFELNLPSTSTGIRHTNTLPRNYYELSDISKTNSEEQTPDNGSECSLVADQLLYNDCLEQSLAYSIYHYDNTRPLSPIMFWDEKDVQSKQFNLLHAGCVTNAVLNALLALDKIPPRIIPEWANQYLIPNMRYEDPDQDLDLCHFLIAKSTALPSHEDLITGIKQVTGGNSIYTRFFPTWPERNFSLSHWLKYWLEHNVIPIITINQQVLQKDITALEWQHHTIFGVSSTGIYLTDPVQCISEDVLHKKLTSDSILLIKRSDILSRWNKTTDLGALYNIEDKRWHRVNTLGKLVHLLREVKSSSTVNEKSATNNYHIPIPTSVRAGITLVSSIDNPACDMIEYCPELPLKKHT